MELLHTFCELQLYARFHSLYTLSEVLHIEDKGTTPCIKWSLQEVKNNGILSNHQAKKWLQSLVRVGHLRDVLL